MNYLALFFIFVFPLFCQALSRPANSNIAISSQNPTGYKPKQVANKRVHNIAISSQNPTDYKPKQVVNKGASQSIKIGKDQSPIVTSTQTKKWQQKEQESIRLILGLPLENRKQALSRYGPQAFWVLRSLLISQKESVPVRWKALTSLARLFPHRSLPLVQKALRSSPWFLQNAGLIAMEIIDPQKAVVWANYFLDSPALVVRTAAVDMIKKHKARQYKSRLLDKLNATDSFYKKKSLWIRSHIVSALSAFPVPGEEPLFISFLQDPDERLHIHAILALEKLTGKTFRPNGEGIELLAQAQKQKWIDWWVKSGYNLGNNSGSSRPVASL